MKYRVGIREVHVNLVEIEIDSVDEQKIKDLADAYSASQSVDIEYSHTMNQNFWTIEKMEPADASNISE